MKFYIETVPQETQAVLDKIKTIPDIQNFYLSGGTALSLLLGHRESEDLDFFIKTPFQPQELQQKLLNTSNLENVTLDEGTLNFFIDKVKLQFSYYPYNLLEDLIPWNGIHLSSVADIACTKLITISMWGSKKDFIDLYVILQQMTLKELFIKLEKKYTDVNYNYPHILKSLVYFEDADDQPMPRMHKDFSWDIIKEEIVKQVKAFTF
ncbi:nucleotidyl transferase AbiEii/AbiGii toxin family protein [Candidatus Roizmanbacteria bacterium]|nr:nucleotidyl transferase AbiEii/AbiGii toxin family protein [Candidatus Roizmanbacteria bacterium]